MDVDLIRLHVDTMRIARARRAERILAAWTVLPFALAAALVALGVRGLVLRGFDWQLWLAIVVLVAILLAIGVAAARRDARARADRKRSVGRDRRVLAVSRARIALADDELSWDDVRAVAFVRRLRGISDATGTPAAYGRRLGERLVAQSGLSQHDIVLTRRDGTQLLFPAGSLLDDTRLAQAENAIRRVAPTHVLVSGRTTGRPTRTAQPRTTALTFDEARALLAEHLRKTAPTFIRTPDVAPLGYEDELRFAFLTDDQARFVDKLTGEVTEVPRELELRKLEAMRRVGYAPGA